MNTKSQLTDKAEYYMGRMTDMRFLGQVIFVMLVLLMSWSGVKAIQTNYGLQKQISTLKQQNDLQQLKNDNLALDNDYYNSNQYLELAARQNFGLAAAGEKEVIVPKSVAMAYTVNLPENKSTAPTFKQSAMQRNFQSWVNFFMNRPNNGN